MLIDPRKRVQKLEMEKQRALLCKLLAEEERMKQHLITRYESQNHRREASRLADEQSLQRVMRVRGAAADRSHSTTHDCNRFVTPETVLEAKRRYSTSERRDQIIRQSSVPVSYTHLTLPTKRIV
eukprot:TRINITY_DN30557_c0_g1_i1.p1 TRINITY_DN30557_c0_g1~~TRINITY_DN30557_c0_g1_i1.p1  ORF type:complete len:125 (-),score=12.11 TRINITY_DN30557_c0_g1_i1:92-466(-)